jgi:aspartyl-tRNA(Asn)/glutamyl-tRNA(Gln) amidotransferase subunit A
MGAPTTRTGSTAMQEEAARRLSHLRGRLAPEVLADAERQLAGMLEGLAQLARSVPFLGNGVDIAQPSIQEEAPPSRSPSATRPAAGVARPSIQGEALPLVAEGAALPPPAAAAGAAAGRPGRVGVSASGPGAELCALSLAELAVRLRRHELSPLEVTRAALDRIAAYDHIYRTFITVFADEALEEARAAEREIAAGRYRGPLHGVPVAVKDLFATRGGRTTCGSAILRDWVPERDAAAVAAWRRAGAIVLGKNTLHEFAFGGTSVNEHTGTPRNPWNAQRICGGSSGGSAAAVAAGFAFGALGSETGNSVRRPASFCGVVGIKPTFGRVSRQGVFPLAWTLDHVGLFARTAADAACLLAPLSGFDPADPGSRHPPAVEGDPAHALAPGADLRGRRAGVPRALLEELDPAVARAFERALAALRDRGVEVVDVALPVAERWTALASSVTMHAEAAVVHAGWLAERPDGYGADVLARLLAGQALDPAGYARAQAIRGAVLEDVLGALRTVDVLIAPGVPAPAPPIQAGAYVPGDAPWSTEPNAFQLQRLFSLTGLPAVAAPCGLSPDGLPLAVQVGGRPWEESLVLGLAAAVIEAVPQSERPPLAPLAAPA